MKNRIRKIMLPIGAVSMTAVMGFLPSGSAFAAAASTIDPSRTGSITIHKYDITTAQEQGAYTEGSITATGQKDSLVENALSGYEIEGVEFSYMKAGDVETFTSGGTSGTVTLVYELPEKLAGILGLQAGDAIDMSGNQEGICTKKGVYHFTSGQVNQAMEVILKSDNISAKNALEDYLKSSGKAVAMPETDTSGWTSVSGLELGLYLLVETAVPEDVVSTVDPWLIQLPFTDTTGSGWVYDMTCYPKNQTGNPSLDKSVRSVDDSQDNSFSDTATASEGDVLEYILVSKMPHITSKATYLTEFTFRDVLSEGLSYNHDAQIYFYHTAEDAKGNCIQNADLVWSSQDGCFTEEYKEDLENGDSGLTVKMTVKGLEVLNQMSDAYIVVDYSTTMKMNKNVVLGDEGNPNDVTLTWRRTSDSYYNTLEDRNYVYSYGIKLTKEFSDRNGDFSNVHFTLYNESDAHYLVAEMESDGTYYVSGKTGKKSEATSFTPDPKTGIILIKGTEADQYLLEETSTDSGYTLLQSPITVKIEGTKRGITASSLGVNGKTDMVVGDIQCASAMVNGEAVVMEDVNAYAVLTVINSRNVTLPQTGGSGLYLLTVLGMIAAAFGCRMVLGKKKPE